MVNGDLTFSLIWTPSIEPNSNAKYTCSDNKVHIRLRDFNKPQIISGFEDKLAYLISFIFFSEKDKTLKDLLSSMYLEDINVVLENYIVNKTGYKYKGLKIKENYSRKDKHNIYGKIDINCFPFSELENCNYLDYFQQRFKINLYDFLFNDAYKIMIHKKQEQKENKFIRKKQKQDLVSNDSDLYNLW